MLAITITLSQPALPYPSIPQLYLSLNVEPVTITLLMKGLFPFPDLAKFQGMKFSQYFKEWYL